MHAAAELSMEATYVANVDARRMEVYAAPFSFKGERLGPTVPMIIEPGVFDGWLALGEVVLCGSGTSKAISMLSSSGIACHPMEPKADYLCPLAFKAFVEGRFDDPASFRPQYIKPPNITTPRKITL
jgi:tRNA threonylcarbamoyladenosine biosynthesis protein TsaB